jgi:hypothetical protein
VNWPLPLYRYMDEGKTVDRPRRAGWMLVVLGVVCAVSALSWWVIRP